MKKILILLLIILSTVFNIYSQDSGFIKKIRAASDFDYPPFCIINPDSTAGGFSVELLKEVCSVMNIQTDIKVGEWNKIKQELADGKIDVLCRAARTPEREPIYDFTFLYLSFHGAVFVRTGTGINNVEDLKDKTIIVLRGGNAEEYCKREKISNNIILTESYKTAFLDLSEGKYDAIITLKVMGLNLLNEMKIKNIRPVIDLNDFWQSFTFAVKEGDRDLLAQLNEGLSIVISNGTFDRIRQKWFLPQTVLGRTTLTIGDDNQYPPYAFINENGVPAGFNIDLIRAVAKELGILVDIKLGVWSEVRKSLEKNEIDAISGMFYSKDRDSLYDFSPPHSISSHAIVVRKGSKVYETIENLRKKKVLVEKGDIMYDYLISKGFDKEIVAVGSQEEALIVLSKGKYDCALVSKILSRFLIDKNKIKNLSVSEKSFLPQEYCFAVKDGNEILLDQLSYALANVKSSGEYRKIYTKWFGTYEKSELNFKRILKYSAAILIPLLMLIIGIMLWNRTLQKQINKKTMDIQHEMLIRKQTEEALKASNKAVTESIIAIKESEEKYRQIFEMASEGIFVTKPDGMILSANPEACRIMGRTEKEIVELGRDKLFDNNDPGFIKSLEIRKKTGSFKGEVVCIKKDGTRTPLFLTTILYKDSKNVEKTITIFTDITERKLYEQKTNEYLKELEKNKTAMMNILKDVNQEVTQRKAAQEELKRLNAELEDKVRERTAQLENQNRELTSVQDSLVLLLEDVNDARKSLELVNSKLVAANKELEAFSYSVSHDLRSPLRAILGFADILREEYCKDLDDEGKRFLSRITDNTKRMQDLVDDLLEYSRVGRSDIRMQKVDMKNMLLKIFEEQTEGLIDRDFDFSINGVVPDVTGDMTLLRQAFGNIIGNAVKFTRGKHISKIKINCGQIENFDIISIEDNGAGFDENYKHKLFEVFQRLHSSEEFPGTGVGLSIVYKVFQKHGWTIDAEGKIGEGAKFIIKIPKRKGDES